ncbi:hypothetical protein FRX31_025478, partial [Thalictrum thalictroides]
MQPFPPPAANANALAGWMANATAASSVQSVVVAASSIHMLPNQGKFSIRLYFGKQGAHRLLHLRS